MLAGQEVNSGSRRAGLPWVNRLPHIISVFLPCPSVCFCLGSNNGLRQISAALPKLNITQVSFCFCWFVVASGWTLGPAKTTSLSGELLDWRYRGAVYLGYDLFQTVFKNENKFVLLKLTYFEFFECLLNMSNFWCDFTDYFVNVINKLFNQF